MPAVKRCPRCGQVKPSSEFNRNRARYDGLQAHCRACHNPMIAPRSRLPGAKSGMKYADL